MISFASLAVGWFVCSFFPSLIKVSLLIHEFFLTFALPVAFPFLLGGSERAAGVRLIAGWSQPTTSMKLEIYSNFHLTVWNLKVDHLEGFFL